MDGRFFDKVSPEPNTGCHLWTASIDDKGYGRYALNHSNVKAHRYALQLDGQEIPAGFIVDHLCRERSCVNPRHLRIVTPRENTMAAGSIAPANLHRLQTHCINGHEFSGENLYMRPAGGRDCKICIRVRCGMTPFRLDPRYCRKGHEFNSENTKIRPNGTRLCRTCVRISKRRKRIVTVNELVLRHRS